MAMIDALFGSKTRVKLLHLFLNNPGTSFYVREITRLVDEQINSVRRELSNMSSVGIISVIKNDAGENKLYYEVNQRYEHYLSLKSIFADSKSSKPTPKSMANDWQPLVRELPGLRIAIAAGVLVENSASKVDLLLVGSIVSTRLQKAMKTLEKMEGRDINYSLMTYDEFYYRLSVRDKFITEILNNNHVIVVDTDKVLKG